MSKQASKELTKKVVKGARDMLPHQMAVKQRALTQIREVFLRHGAQEIDTPVFERREVLMEKYGENSKLVYDLADQGGEMLSLRYDLTVPFARFMATHNLTKLKRFQIGKVYRRDQPNNKGGRFREFYQCDFDIAGPSLPMLADAEVLKVFSELLGNFKLDFNLRVNDRRLLESALITRTGIVADKFKSICHVLDRLDKEPWEKCAESLIEIGVTGEQLAKIEEFVKSTSSSGGSSESVHQAINRLDSMIDNKEVLKELRLLGDYVDAMGIAERVKLDMSLVRGLDYYTGMIFEAAIVGGEEANLGLGSIAAGGRYDDLIGMFGKNQIPAAGGSLGIERIFNILETRAEKELYIANPIDIVVGSIGQVPKQEILKIASWLWDQGLKTEIFYEETQKMGEQIKFAANRGAKYLVIAGEDELKDSQIILRNLTEKRQEKVSFARDNLIKAINSITK